MINIEKAIKIGGWMSEPELRWLAIQAQSRKRIVEFGSLHGRSSRAIADNMHPEGILYCVDPWAGVYYSEDGNPIPLNTYVYPHFVRNMKDHIEAGRVIPIRDYSKNFPRTKPGTILEYFDMIFIDGDHTQKGVAEDIAKAVMLASEDALICGHDYGHPEWPSVKKVVDFIFKHDQIQVTESIWSVHSPRY